MTPMRRDSFEVAVMKNPRHSAGSDLFRVALLQLFISFEELMLSLVGTVGDQKAIACAGACVLKRWPSSGFSF
jgi:hypothetical protein